MRKIVIYSLLFLLLFLIIEALFFTNASNTPEDKLYVEDAQQSYKSLPQKNEINQISVDNLIDTIYVEASQGKFPDVGIIAGETSVEKVEEQWGAADVTGKLNKSVYVEYPNQDLAFGYANSIVFDVRVYDGILQEIHLEDIVNYKGDPDEKRYYKDDDYDQVILVYNLNETYQLKWILDNPKADNQNPSVHHISVVANVQLEEQTLEEKIKNMPLKEKIGQMIIGGISGTSLTSETEKLITDHQLGGVIFYADNLANEEQAKNLVNDIKDIEKPIPLFLSVDQEGGQYTRLPGYELPINNELGKINNPEKSFQIGQTIAEQLINYGMNMNYAPVLDINSNPDNPVINERAFGDNPEIVSRLGIQTMKGMQSKNIISVIKHFPGHGDTSVESHLELPEVEKSLQDLQELELIPFDNAINEGADVVMVAHILLPLIDAEFPATMSKTVITDILREDLDFNGVVVTDDLTMDAIANHYDIGHAAVQSIKAGSDIILIAHEYSNIVDTIKTLIEAVEKGEITEERIDESVRRILELKEEYELRR